MLEYHSRNYHELCYSISSDEPLKTMFRVNGGGVPCPIQGTFSFSYSRGHGLCSYPTSSLHQCADKSQLVLSYQACVDIKGSQSHTEQAQCIGNWKEGSTYYFAAVMNSSHISRYDKEDSFRCFVYKQIHNGYLMSQSADASCHLYTATEGYRTMTLSQLKEDDRSCQFPGWLTQHLQYISLNAATAFSVNQPGNVITIQPQGDMAYASKDELKSTRLECISEKQVGNDSARYTVQSVQSCQQATFHCVHIWRRTNNVLEIKIGKSAPNNEDACHEQLFFDNSIPIQTITSDALHASPCPLTGNFLLSNKEDKMNGKLESQDQNSNHIDEMKISDFDNCFTDGILTAGCDNTNKITLKNSCSKQNTELLCHEKWHEENLYSKKQYTIVSYETSHSTSAKGCLVKTTSSRQDSLELSLQDDCSSQSRKIWSKSAANFGDCAPTALATANSSDKSLPRSILILMTVVAILIQSSGLKFKYYTTG